MSDHEIIFIVNKDPSLPNQEIMSMVKRHLSLFDQEIMFMVKRHLSLSVLKIVLIVNRRLVCLIKKTPLSLSVETKSQARLCGSRDLRIIIQCLICLYDYLFLPYSESVFLQRGWSNLNKI